eukprot:jgi/Botrbrau1/11928/Bobra.0259s0017.1
MGVGWEERVAETKEEGRLMLMQEHTKGAQIKVPSRYLEAKAEVPKSVL